MQFLSHYIFGTLKRETVLRGFIAPFLFLHFYFFHAFTTSPMYMEWMPSV